MEIPNYDTNNGSDTNFKQLYPFMPKDTFRMLLAGNSSSGKTNLLYHILMSPLVYYDQIHLCAKNLEQDKCQTMIKEMNEISKHVGHDVLICNNDDILPVSKLLNTDLQRIVIFDDFVCEKNQKPLIDYFIQGRQKLFSNLFNTKFLRLSKTNQN